MSFIILFLAKQRFTFKQHSNLWSTYHLMQGTFTVYGKIFINVSLCRISPALLVTGRMRLLFQSFWCRVHPHQKQNSPPACHRPRHRECTLYSHTQEDPQVPPALCEWMLTLHHFLIPLTDRWCFCWQLCLISCVCIPLVVNVAINKRVLVNGWRVIVSPFCADVWNAKASFHEADSRGAGHWYLPRHCFHPPGYTHHQSTQHLCGETSFCSACGGWLW